jgi:mRNA interferase HicA
MKYNELFRILKKEGWVKSRQSGSHVVLIHPDKNNQLIIPCHGGKEVKKGFLKAIFKVAGIEIKKR